jgi:hypothetical protein
MCGSQLGDELREALTGPDLVVPRATWWHPLREQRGHEIGAVIRVAMAEYPAIQVAGIHPDLSEARQGSRPAIDEPTLPVVLQ